LSEPQKKLRNELVKTLTKLIVLSAFLHSFLTTLSKPALLDVTISRFLRNSPFTVSNGVAADSLTRSTRCKKRGRKMTGEPRQPWFPTGWLKRSACLGRRACVMHNCLGFMLRGVP